MKTRTFVLGAVIAVIGSCTACVWVKSQRTEAVDIFRQYVLDPIPMSVTHIRTSQPKTVGGYGYTLGFTIERSDLTVILDSRPLKRVQSISYENGFLCWDWDPSPSVQMSPYPSKWWPSEPKWFHELEEWKDVEAYALREERKDGRMIEVLIYNSELKEAIFLTFLKREG